MKAQLTLPAVLLLVGAVVFDCGCHAPRVQNRSAKLAEASASREPPTEAERTRDAAVIGMFTKELRQLSNEWVGLHGDVRGRTREQLTEEQSDRIESLLFRYVTCRESLVELGNDYSGTRLIMEPNGRARTTGALLGVLARLLIRNYDVLLSALFYSEAGVRAKLNEAYPDGNIEAGTYDKLLEAATSETNRQLQEAAWRLLSEELSNPYSSLSRSVQNDAQCSVLARVIQLLHEQKEDRTLGLVRKRAERDSRHRVYLDKASVGALMQRSREASETSLDAAVALDSRGIVQVIAAIISPPLALTEAQSEALDALIQPGDVMLIYRKGYLSNLFFPGTFIHAIAYVGSGEPASPADPERDSDAIEAVAAGVVRSSLAYLVDGNISRMAVLRPRVSDEEREAAIEKLEAYLGRGYDLAFNFASDQRLCCTETIYHVFNGLGAIDFKLVKRLGLKTLSADDVIKHALEDEAEAFDVVCVLDEDPGSRGKRALLLTGDDAAEHLRALLGL